MRHKRKKQPVYSVKKSSRKVKKVKRERTFHFSLARWKSVGKWIFKIGVVCLFAYVTVWYFGQRVSVIGDSMNPVLHIAEDLRSPERLRRSFLHWNLLFLFRAKEMHVFVSLSDSAEVIKV